MTDKEEYEMYRKGVKKFAWLPIKTSSGKWLWLQSYWVVCFSNFRGWKQFGLGSCSRRKEL